MNQPYNEQDALISSIFSDETPLFRTPAEPEIGDAVTVRLRIRRGADARVYLLKGFPAVHMKMFLLRSDAMFDWYDAKLYCRDKTIYYSFLIELDHIKVLFNRTGPRVIDTWPSPDPAASFRVMPGFHVPEWSKGAIQYQIFPDRFRSGGKDNDVWNREYYYVNDHIRHSRSWDDLPSSTDYRCLYGGDLRGVMEKLDYLQSLGVEAIYFNPIFVSPSSHKYDTQDYAHVDPHLTLILNDSGEVLGRRQKDNSRASLYIQRTTDLENLEASDAYFAGLCQEMHRRGMKIILDGVFNHCGSFNHWMDREGLYKNAPDRQEGAYGNPDSPFRNYFLFKGEREYHSWWDVVTLPKLYYERSEALCEEIYSIAEKWASPPYSIDGWRLDVAADLGQSRAFNHRFWKTFRQRVKAVNPNVLIIAEHYGNPAEWLDGDEWDSVMNYDAFMDPLSFFLTGMEKHSDYRRDDLYQNGMAFFHSIFENMAHMSVASMQCAMNELSNHDHSRFLTRTNGRPGRLDSAGSAAAGEGVRFDVFREAAVVLMTWPGAPTLYYGDEAGVVGWTDPDNRRTYPWGREDRQLIALFRALAHMREQLPVLKQGSVKPLCAGHGYIAYARFDANQTVAVALNNTERPMVLRLPLRDIGVPDGAPIVRLFATDEDGFDEVAFPVGMVLDGVVRVDLPCHSAVVLGVDEAESPAGTP